MNAQPVIGRAKRMALRFVIVILSALVVASAGSTVSASDNKPPKEKPVRFTVKVECSTPARKPGTSKCVFRVHGSKAKKRVESFLFPSAPCAPIRATSEDVEVVGEGIRFWGNSGWVRFQGEVIVDGAITYLVVAEGEYAVDGPGIFCPPGTEENAPPVAADDSFAVDEDGSLAVEAPGPLGNDSDAEGDPLSATLVAPPANGALTLNGDGSFSYAPFADFNGTDAFTYVANDAAGMSNVATVTIEITAVNDPPTAGDDGYATDEDLALSVGAPGVLENDADRDSATIAAVIVEPPAHGSLALQADGSFLYTPDADFNGSDSFSYQATDGDLAGGAATVAIIVNPVNDAPTAADDQLATDEDVSLMVTAPGPLGNDTDVDGDALIASLVDGPAHGALTLNLDGSLDYAPVSDFNGVDAFTYRVGDGSLASGVATVTIVVNAVNDPPVPVDDAFAVDEDTELMLNAADLLGNDGDVEGDALVIVAVEQPSHGATTLNPDGSVTYTAAADFNGEDAFGYTVDDGSGNGRRGVARITVRPVNDAPVGRDDSYETNEETQLSVAAPGVLANDGDVDGDALTATIVRRPTNASFSLRSDGSFTFTPGSNVNGQVTFSYRISDGRLTSGETTVTITVHPVNDPPRANDDTRTTPLNTPRTITVLANDGDTEGGVLRVVAVGSPAHGTATIGTNGANVVYTPNTGYEGIDAFSYTIEDEGGAQATAAVAITVGAAAPATVTVVTVELGTGAPVFDACFALHADLGGGALGPELRFACDVVRTNGQNINDGRITFTNIAPGAYVIVNDVRPDNHDRSPNAAVTIAAGAATEVTTEHAPS